MKEKIFIVLLIVIILPLVEGMQTLLPVSLKLKDSNGLAVTGTQTVTVYRMLTSNTVGSYDWSETLSVTFDSSGVAHFLLGESTEFPPFNQTYYLLFNINGENMTTTTTIGKVPYADYAEFVNLSNTNNIGTLPISKGGTGATSASNARNNLGSAGVGNCDSGYVVQNTTINGVECQSISLDAVTRIGSTANVDVTFNQDAYFMSGFKVDNGMALWWKENYGGNYRRMIELGPYNDVMIGAIDSMYDAIGTSNRVLFYWNGSKSMTLYNDNLGIGNTSEYYIPEERLEVFGNVDVKNNNVTNVDYIKFSGGGCIYQNASGIVIANSCPG